MWWRYLLDFCLGSFAAIVIFAIAQWLNRNKERPGGR